MSRTVARAIVLVNWQGVFYERYLLDRHVTALEGANGAGKTTVMIAAYVVLLPDMSRLRFSTVAEGSATGGDKGIWGRLGEPGRPSYAAIEFELAGGRRTVAGVHLERKGEPTVEATPFIISDLSADVRLQDLMLIPQGESEAVPELPELRESAVLRGGAMRVFQSARDYFAALFDLGVTPLRLGTHEELSKLNEMLRTSMTGGISRTLTSELRTFLLKEKSGLSDTLQRVRANLDACRRTRSEVKESRHLQQEIEGILTAGQTMFAAAYLATQDRAEDHERKVAEAEKEHREASEAYRVAHEVFEQITSERADLKARSEVGAHRLAEEQEQHRRLREALIAADEVAAIRTELAAQDVEEHQAAQDRDRAGTARTHRDEEYRRAQEDYARAAAGLADLQQGIEQLYRRAGAFRQVTNKLREAEARLGGISIPTEEIQARIERCETELGQFDEERRTKRMTLADADHHQRCHGEMMAALRSLVDEELVAEVAHERALAALRRHRDLRALAEQAEPVARQLDQARVHALRQDAARAKAKDLGITRIDGPAGPFIDSLLADCEAEQAQEAADERDACARLRTVEDNGRTADLRRCELEASEPLWRNLDACARRLAAYMSAPIVDGAGLDRARSLLREDLAAVQQRQRDLHQEKERLLREAHELIALGGTWDVDLLRLKDQLGATLVASCFDDVAIDEAGVLEARLGVLAQGLVVDDPVAAAHEVGARVATLPQLWLVARDTDLTALSIKIPVETAARDVVIEEGPALRVSRIPTHPRLGRRAREARAAALREKVAALSPTLDEAGATRRRLEGLVKDGEALLAGQSLWLASNPAPRIAGERRLIAEAQAEAGTLQEKIARHRETAQVLRPRIAGLRQLLGDALLLDLPDHRAEMERLETALRTALNAQAEVQRTTQVARMVEEGLAVLREPPMSQDELVALRVRIAELETKRDCLDVGLEALGYVRDNLTALGWADAPARLDDNQALVPALKAQLDDAELARDQAGARAQQAVADHNAAFSRWQDIDGRRKVSRERLFAAEARFQGFGLPEVSEELVRKSALEVKRLADEQRQLQEKSGEIHAEYGRRENKCAEADAKRQQAEDRLAGEQREAEPAVARLRTLRESAMRHRLLGDVQRCREGKLRGIRGHVNLVQAAREQRALLKERLGRAQGGPDLLAQLAVLNDPSDVASTEAILDLWLTVRDWLRRRLPAQITEVDDPQEALYRLGDQLAALEERLNRQEEDLRGDSEHVARGIEVQIREAQGHVRRLNRNLEGIGFGNIAGIQVRPQPVDKMNQVLQALRDGKAQSLLFQDQLPIEDALEEIFRRYAGGRGGGQRLLDYREYIHLQVEVRRKSRTSWEIANPSHLSTGEAIGVGAALMMVVLTEWERDASVLRGKRSQGSLRFLFLDEANRLDHDNLGVLFDLCETLELQLLIAAPEVARAAGNTTYHLVRDTGKPGHEEVLVSGRRTAMTN